jgi:peptidoglycan L-alanyl-D-glutamate endopeptidase CwlK
MTDDAFVRLFQTRAGLVSDGIVGPATLAALDKAFPPSGGVLEAPEPMLTGWDTRSAKNLQGVHVDLVRVMSLARTRSPVKFTVIEGLRTVERQRQLVAQGASKTMNSRHITGHAVDIVPHRPDGTLAFDWPLYYKVAPVIKAAAKELGIPIEWGGDWRTFKDGPHWQLPHGNYPA